MNIVVYTSNKTQILSSLRHSLSAMGNIANIFESESNSYIELGTSTLHFKEAMPSYILKLRDTMSLPGFAIIGEIYTQEYSNNKTIHDIVDSSVNLPVSSYMSGSPNILPKFDLSSSKNDSNNSNSNCSNGSSSNIFIKEVVLPYNNDVSMRQHIENVLISNTNVIRNRNGVFTYSNNNNNNSSSSSDNSNNDCSFRLLPINTTSLILGVESIPNVIDQAVSTCKSSIQSTRSTQSIPTPISDMRWVGSKSAGHRHLCISPLLLQFGLDIRLCDNMGISPFFNECTEAMLDDLLPGVQSARLLGGDESVKETKYGHFGDCYSEFREQMRSNPSRFLFNQK